MTTKEHYHHWKPCAQPMDVVFECSVCGEKYVQKARIDR
jgi:hypothetical protein